MFSATVSDNMKKRWDILEGIIGDDININEDQKDDAQQQHSKQLEIINLNIDIRRTIKGLEQKYMLIPELTKEIHLTHFLRKMLEPEGECRS